MKTPPPPNNFFPSPLPLSLILNPISHLSWLEEEMYAHA
jgi:hypothetical protein